MFLKGANDYHMYVHVMMYVCEPEMAIDTWLDTTQLRSGYVVLQSIFQQQNCVDSILVDF